MSRLMIERVFELDEVLKLQVVVYRSSSGALWEGPLMRKCTSAIHGAWQRPANQPRIVTQFSL